MCLLSFVGLKKYKVEAGKHDEPKWKGAVEDKEKLTLNDAKFLFEQANKFLKDTAENSNQVKVEAAIWIF